MSIFPLFLSIELYFWDLVLFFIAIRSVSPVKMHFDLSFQREIFQGCFLHILMFYQNICLSRKACWQNPFLMLMSELWSSLHSEDLYSTTLPIINLRWRLFISIWLCLLISETILKGCKNSLMMNQYSPPLLPPYKTEH